MERKNGKAKRGKNFENQVAVGNGKCIREIKQAKNAMRLWVLFLGVK